MSETERSVSVRDACNFEVGSSFLGGVVIGVDRERNLLRVKGDPQSCCIRCTEAAKVSWTKRRMILCPKCGNKRCPKATWHQNECTGSNESGQQGSDY